MNYNPNIHHRRSIRLKGYDYSQAGMYFITVCCDERKCWYGEIKNEMMVLNDYGKIAHDEWFDLPNRFLNIELGEFVVMPNHIHGIIVIAPVGATLAVAPLTNADVPDDKTATTIDVGATLAVAPLDRATLAVAPLDRATLAVAPLDRATLAVAPLDRATARVAPTGAPSSNAVVHDDEMATAMNKMATEFDKRATEFDKMTTASDTRATASDTRATASDTRATASDTRATASDTRATARVAPTVAPTTAIGNIVGAYKSLVANKCLDVFKNNNPNIRMGKLWQRNYWEHIIRNEQSFEMISNYVRENPKNWDKDKLNAN